MANRRGEVGAADYEFNSASDVDGSVSDELQISSGQMYGTS